MEEEPKTNQNSSDEDDDDSDSDSENEQPTAQQVSEDKKKTRVPGKVIKCT
jgi:hypothetical protein